MSVQPQRGFTLIELVIALLIAAILVTVGIPSYQNIIRTNLGTAIANEALTAINFARAEAIKRGLPVSVCSSNKGLNWLSCAGSTDWAKGYMVFADINGDGVFTDDGDANTCETDASNAPTEDCLLRVWDRHKRNNTVTASANSLTYNSAGSASPSPFTITPIWPDAECIKDRQQEWTVTVTAVGRASVSKSDCL